MSNGVFTKSTLLEMLKLRSEGRSLISLARMYGVDHTTIIYHCQKYRIIPFQRMPEIEVTLVERLPRKEHREKTRIELLLEEPVNPGKNYTDYLREEKQRKEMRMTSILTIRI